MAAKINHSFRLTRTAATLLSDVSVKLGISMTACLEIAIRRMAAQEGVFPENSDERE